MKYDRINLEWLIYFALTQDEPIISISRGKELLGFTDMQQMRDWMNDYKVNEEHYWQMQIEHRFIKNKKIKRVKTDDPMRCHSCFLIYTNKCKNHTSLVQKCSGYKYWCRDGRGSKIIDYIFVEVK